MRLRCVHVEGRDVGRAISSGSKTRSNSTLYPLKRPLYVRVSIPFVHDFAMPRLRSRWNGESLSSKWNVFLKDFRREHSHPRLYSTRTFQSWVLKQSGQKRQKIIYNGVEFLLKFNSNRGTKRKKLRLNASHSWGSINHCAYFLEGLAELINNGRRSPGGIMTSVMTVGA